jgi:hypothetical protein
VMNQTISALFPFQQTMGPHKVSCTWA